MKRIVLAAAAVAGAGGAAWAAAPEEVQKGAAVAWAAAVRAWEGVAANPGPVVVAGATFLVTVLYHAARGKSLRESVEAAATRVKVVEVPRPADEPEPAVVRRAKARATRAQLIADQIHVQNRIRKLPEAITRAEKEACYTEAAVTEAAKALAEKRKAHGDAVAALKALRAELAAGEAEHATIDVELKKLAGAV